MRPIGFSTGALAKGDFQRGLDLQRNRGITAIELSALRERELIPLVKTLPRVDLSGFHYFSIHLPSSLSDLSEDDVLAAAADFPPDWPLVTHPNTIGSAEKWQILGDRLCIENMDQRKPVGRTLAEIDAVFERLPRATFCLDLGHARQVDPTMGIALAMLRKFTARLRQFHLSDVGLQGQHLRIGFAFMDALRRIAAFMPPGVPLILETPVAPDDMDAELELAQELLALHPRLVAL